MNMKTLTTKVAAIALTLLFALGVLSAPAMAAPTAVEQELGAAEQVSPAPQCRFQFQANSADWQTPVAFAEESGELATVPPTAAGELGTQAQIPSNPQATCGTCSLCCDSTGTTCIRCVGAKSLTGDCYMCN